MTTKQNKIEILKSKNCKWFNITANSKKEIDFIKKNFNFHPLNIQDCQKYSAQRPKFNEYSKYFFIVLLFPVYNRKTGIIHATEIDCFLGDDYLITIHDNSLEPLKNLYKNCSVSRATQCEFLTDPASLYYEMLERLINYCYPILDHISLDIDNIGKELFDHNEKMLIKKILTVKMNIFNARKIMRQQENVLKKILQRSPRLIEVDNLRVYFENLIEHTQNIWDILENQSQIINALHQSSESYISFRMDNAIKKLTVFSAIFLPVSFLAWLFGMNTPMSFLNNDYAFIIILIIMALIILFNIHYFKNKKII